MDKRLIVFIYIKYNFKLCEKWESLPCVNLQKLRQFKRLELAYTYGDEMYHIFDNGNMTYTQWLNQTPSQLIKSEIRTYTNFNLRNNIPGVQSAILYYQNLLSNLK